MKRVAITTLGCKVNTFESELIMQRFDGYGYRRVEPEQMADIYIINSCTVTAEADRQSRQVARRLKRQNQGAMVVMTGCYAQNQGEAVSDIEEVDWVVGNVAKLDIPRLVREQESRDEEFPAVIRPPFTEQPALPEDLLGGYEGQSRAFIQIQQGCDQACTFCIIHTARGPSISFPVQMVLAQYQKIVNQGYKEVVLCGVDLGAYGDELGPGHSLERLIQAMLELQLDCRLRISSIDPCHLSDGLIDLFEHSEQLCPHIHLSMQSANDLILKRMKRRADRALIFNRVARLRRARPELVLSADVLVGFPTETEAQFMDTLDAIEALQISYPHVFPYSNREGTPAAKIPAQLTGPEKKARARRAREAGQKVWQSQARARVGRTERTIIEPTAHSSGVIARCDDYFPVKLAANSSIPVRGQWCQVQISGVDGQSLLGECLGCD